MGILILSTSTNEHASAVEKKLSEKTQEVVRVDMDQVVCRPYRFCFTKDDSKFFVEDKPFYARSITSVFVHHPNINTNASLGIDDLDRALYVSGWRNAIDWFEQTLTRANWVNAPHTSRRAASVAFQLHTAEKVGFRTPETLFTNSVEQLYEFAKQHRRIIVKPGPLLGLSLGNQRLLTQIIEPESINNASLNSSPCLFQEYVEKSYELRVHVICDRVLACRIDSQNTEATKIDWRNYAINRTPHKRIEIGKSISEKCIRVVKNLGLRFGILDLIVTSTDDIVFLECNSQGHWLWIELLTGLPVTDALCEELLMRHP